MALSRLQKNLHLLSRAGFGPSLHQLPGLDRISPEQLWRQLASDSREVPPKIEATQPRIDREKLRLLPEEAQIAARQAAQKQTRLELQRLSGAWLKTLADSPAQLRERMAFFWHGHFATRIGPIDFNRDLLHIFREKGLGKFGDLLLAVSQSPAMLLFLNNQQNRKAKPNENFAREAMELFTLGRGHYTEKDVKEAARAFTGWTYATVPLPSASPEAGEAYFLFRPKAHDEGLKTFLGKTGPFKGEDILRILLEQKQTARFLTEKIYRHFVNEKPDEKRVADLSRSFYNSGYDIGVLLERIFTASWFFDSQNVGNRIKSPVELLAGIRRIMPFEFGNPSGLFVLQNMLGQTLLQPPNVAGWPLGKAWIDSSSLLLRLQLPYIVAGTEALQGAPKPDDDLQMGKKATAENLAIKPVFSPNLLQSRVLWKETEEALRGLTVAQLASYLMVRPEKAPVALAMEAVRPVAAANHTRTSLLRLMSLPEYQLG